MLENSKSALHDFINWLIKTNQVVYAKTNVKCKYADFI